MTYVTNEDDTVDAIAWAELGSEVHVVAIMEANPRLADRGPLLPAGLTLTPPSVAEPVQGGDIRLWGRT